MNHLMWMATIFYSEILQSLYHQVLKGVFHFQLVSCSDKFTNNLTEVDFLKYKSLLQECWLLPCIHSCCNFNSQQICAASWSQNSTLRHNTHIFRFSVTCCQLRININISTYKIIEKPDFTPELGTFKYDFNNSLLQFSTVVFCRKN